MCWISCIFLHERMVHFQEYQPMNKIYQLRNQNINSTKDKNSFFGGAKLLFSNRSAKKDGISMLVHNSNSNYLYSPCRPITCVHKEWRQKLFKLEIISEFFAAHRVKPLIMLINQILECAVRLVEDRGNLKHQIQYQSGIFFQM